MFVRSRSFNEVFFVGAGTPVWCTGEMLGTNTVVVSADDGQTPNAQIQVIATRAGCPGMTHVA